MITWKLDEKQADHILQVLAARPYGEVSALIQELVKQANANVPQQAVLPLEVPKTSN